MKTKIAVAMSGGVDSAVAAARLLRAGYDVYGVSFLLHGEDDGGAAAAARELGIPFTLLDGRARFRETVKADFIAEYAAGRTPNPCVTCNREIKFPLLVEYADRCGIPLTATGHYARRAEVGGRYAVARAADTAKDQSYMLYALSQETLARCVFPLGDSPKEAIRAEAASLGLTAAERKDSQDICFVPDGDYTAFLAAAGVPLPPGVFTDAEGRVLGEAKNQAAYTLGQRKGLGIALGRPVFVAGKDAENNRILLSPEDPTVSVVRAGRLSFMACTEDELTAGRRVTAKLRYTRAEYPALARLEGDILTVTLDTPARAPAAGQSLVLYDGDAVAAGGIILE